MQLWPPGLRRLIVIYQSNTPPPTLYELVAVGGRLWPLKLRGLAVMLAVPPPAPPA